MLNKPAFFSAYLIHIWHTWGRQPFTSQHAQWRVAGQRAGRQSTARLNTDRQTCTHAHIHTYRQFRVSSLPDSRAALSMWEETIEEEEKIIIKEPTQTCENSAQEEPRDQTWVSVRGGDSVKPESTPDQCRLFHECVGRGGIAVFFWTWLRSFTLTSADPGTEATAIWHPTAQAQSKSLTWDIWQSCRTASSPSVGLDATSSDTMYFYLLQNDSFFLLMFHWLGTGKVASLAINAACLAPSSLDDTTLVVCPTTSPADSCFAALLYTPTSMLLSRR